MAEIYRITLKIHRYDPDGKKTWVQAYHLEAGRILRFVDLFRKINDEQDPSLTWNSSCEHGQCGTCSVLVNGKPLLACELLVENAVNYFRTRTFTIKPINVAPVVRDLVVDMEKAYEKINLVKPFVIDPAPLPTEGDVYPVTPNELEQYVNATRCINCFCCASACISSHKNFLGPNALLASIVRVMDPREREKDERFKVLYSDQGVSRCHSSQACTFVCPKEIDVAHFIALAKQGSI
ncbi:MAG: succinate dehydrogenase/fumarate reductase iron-sulfur subunit [Deltaproteobacteria bacterium]|nr:succinate dehydrogenase/fumarate reductase iron-sulfur subunit [Deltaproteobacteria bacterium]